MQPLSTFRVDRKLNSLEEPVAAQACYKWTGSSDHGIEGYKFSVYTNQETCLFHVAYYLISMHRSHVTKVRG